MILRGFACWMVPRAVGGSIRGEPAGSCCGRISHIFAPKKKIDKKVFQVTFLVTFEPTFCSNCI